MRKLVGAVRTASVAATLVALTTAGAISAQTEPSQAIAPHHNAVLEAAQTLIPILRGSEAPNRIFTPSFLQEVPADQVIALFAQLRAQHGAPQSVASMTPADATAQALVIIRYERALLHFQIYVGGDGKISGLRYVNATVENDNFARIGNVISSLPGSVAWGVFRLDQDGVPALLSGTQAQADMAVGSSFKLTILATLDDDIRHGRANWADIVRIDRQSVPFSGILAWPMGAPMTVHTLATLMISESDNRATDILLHHLGREHVEAFARAHGGLSGPHAYPLLSTLEATALKNPVLGPVRDAWLTGSEADRRRSLARSAARLTPENVDYAIFTQAPADITTIEWFASPQSIAQLLGWLARNASAETRAILAINPGIPAAAAHEWSYVGYKGGSEPGVMAMNLLLRNSAGQYFVVATAWNNPTAVVDDDVLVGLVTRLAAATLAEGSANSAPAAAAPQRP
jgi:beta-lactamase class A